MNHRQRLAACILVTKRIVKRHGREVLATGVTGSVGRGTDAQYSDIDFSVLVRNPPKLLSHRFILQGCLFSVAARTEEDWMSELTRPNHALPLVVGSLKSMRVLYDPHGRLERLKGIAEEIPVRCWTNAVRAGLEEMVEDLGRVRNAYLSKDMKTFRLFSPTVAMEAALVYSSSRRLAVLTERGLLDPKTQRYPARLASALMTGLGEEAKAEQVLNALETLFKSVYKEASLQAATPVAYNSVSSYTPP